MPSDEKKEEGRYGNIKVFSCKTRCRALSLRVEVGGFLILVWGLGVFFFFFFCYLAIQVFKPKPEQHGLKPNSKLNARAAELSLTLFGVLGANHFEDHKSHIV